MDKEKVLKKLKWIENKALQIHDFVDEQDHVEILPTTMGVFVAVGDVIKEIENKDIIKMAEVPENVDLTECITLEEENNKLREERDILLERKTDDRVVTETILNLRKENKKLREAIQSAIDCLTSGNSVMVSDPRPALKFLKDALK